MRTPVPHKGSTPVDRLLAAALASNRKPAATRVVYRTARFADSQAAIDRLVAKNLAFTAGYYLRSWRLMSISGRERLRRTIRPVAREHLRRITDSGQGALLVSLHLGDFDLAGHWLASELGRELVVASPAIRPAWRRTIYTRTRVSAGFRVRDQGHTTLRDLACDIRNGHFVLFLADRRSAGRSIAARFLGCRSIVTTAPAWLSASTGAPIMTAATFSERADDRQLVFGAPQWASTPEDDRWTSRALAELESAVRRAPHQWHIPADLTQMSLLVESAGPRANGSR